MSLVQQIKIFGTVRSVASLKSDIADELDFHIQSRADELIRTGLSSAEAKRQSNEEFGDRAVILRRCQRIRLGGGSWLSWLSIVGLPISVFVIGWLVWSLNAMRTENIALTNLLELRGAAIPSTETTSAASLPIHSQRQDKKSLSGHVKDADKLPVANAKILLVHKSWPGGQYQQDVFESSTDEKGEYRFENQYDKTMQNAFLVTVLADGHELQSRYKIFNAGKLARPFDFRLKKAKPVTFNFVHRGQPLADTQVAISLRTADKKDHHIYAQSRESATWTTDAKGKLSFAFFQPGDQIVLSLLLDNQWQDHKIAIGDGNEQTVDLDAAAPGTLSGTVTAEGGDPIADTLVLLVHKSWPNGRYDQQVFETHTDNNGKFLFRDQFVPGSRNAFLVTIVGPGHEMQSRYKVFDEGSEVDLFDFRLQEVDETKLQFLDDDGNPLANVEVFVSERGDGQDTHIMYAQSKQSATWTTDDQGRLSLALFRAGDKIKFGVGLNGGWEEVNFTVDPTALEAEEVQLVTVKKKRAR